MIRTLEACKTPSDYKSAIEILNSSAFSEDTYVLGFDGYGNFERNNIRIRQENQYGLRDVELEVKNNDIALDEQLSPKSKYRILGQKVLNKSTNQKSFIFENLRDVPDGNGLRAKNPLNGGGKKIKYIKSHLEKLKQAGIKTIIDFRAENVCSAKAINMAKEMGFEYIRFTIDDKWDVQSLNDIKKYIDAVNKGDYIAGCANGQARTDLAMAINYIFNPKAKSKPDFYYGSVSRASRVSIRENIQKILSIAIENENIIKNFGWADMKSFIEETSKRFQYLNNEQ